MPQTSGRLFDELSRLVTDAAGLAEGARREVETLVRSQLERLMSGMDIVSREEFEAAKDMAAKARVENDALAARIAALEAKLGQTGSESSKS
jgi:BMFP domain-containing protein YqiC